MTICFSDINHNSKLLVFPKDKDLSFRLYSSDVKKIEGNIIIYFVLVVSSNHSETSRYYHLCGNETS